MNIVATIIGVIILSLTSPPVSAGKSQVTRIAAASNFTGPLEEIARRYKASTGRVVEVVFSSTGKLYAQIKNGAPYDLYLAADSNRPQLLAREGLCEEPFTYATGEVVLWSKKNSFSGVADWKDVVTNDQVKTIGIASPQTAPYGSAAFEALTQRGLKNAVKPKLVYGQNVAQPFQYAFLGSTDISFTAFSLALSEKGKQGTFWKVPEAGSVVQKGCVVRRTGNRSGVEAFLAFFDRESGVLNEFGYR